MVRVLGYRYSILYLDTMDRVAPAVSHMVAKNRASHCRLPSHAMRVLAAAAALPIVAAGRWECPAGSISGEPRSNATDPRIQRPDRRGGFFSPQSG